MTPFVSEEFESSCGELMTECIRRGAVRAATAQDLLEELSAGRALETDEELVEFLRWIAWARRERRDGAEIIDPKLILVRVRYLRRDPGQAASSQPQSQPQPQPLAKFKCWIDNKWANSNLPFPPDALPFEVSSKIPRGDFETGLM
jgi:hypothetical protein